MSSHADGGIRSGHPLPLLSPVETRKCATAFMAVSMERTPHKPLESPWNTTGATAAVGPFHVTCLWKGAAGVSLKDDAPVTAAHLLRNRGFASG